METDWAHELVMRGSMMFGNVVRQVSCAWAPVYMELFLVYSILNPVESHINSLGLLNLDVVVGNATSRRIVDLDWCWSLLVSHFIEGCTEHGCFFHVCEESSGFGFIGRGDNNLDHSCGSKDRAVDEVVVFIT